MHQYNNSIVPVPGRLFILFLFILFGFTTTIYATDCDLRNINQLLISLDQIICQLSMYFTLRLSLRTKISKTRFDSRLKYCVTRSWLYIVVELLIGVKLTIFLFCYHFII